MESQKKVKANKNTAYNNLELKWMKTLLFIEIEHTFWETNMEDESNFVFVRQMWLHIWIAYHPFKVKHENQHREGDEETMERYRN